MDSVTQFTLGAAVGVTVLGRKIGPRKAAITGGLLGTLPDLDVLILPDDPIDAFLTHRGWTHSFLVHVALTPVLGELVRRIFKPMNGERALSYAAVFLCLTTHAMLDALTIYGTQLFWPIWPKPLFLGSVFIIDPAYTIPLLVAVIGAFFLGRWGPRYRKVLTVCFALSLVYLGWSVTAQQLVAGKAQAFLERYNVKPEKLLATPTPFNTLFWHVIGVDGDRSFSLHVPAFGDPATANFYAYNRNLNLLGCDAADDRAARVGGFSGGYYRVMEKDGEVSVADLRMGLTPDYAFRFTLGRLSDSGWERLPTRRQQGRGDIGADLDWLKANLRGESTVRPAEAAAKMDVKDYAASATATPGSTLRC